MPLKLLEIYILLVKFNHSLKCDAQMLCNILNIKPIIPRELRDQRAGDVRPYRCRSIHHHLTVNAQFPGLVVCSVMTNSPR